MKLVPLFLAAFILLGSAAAAEPAQPDGRSRAQLAADAYALVESQYRAGMADLERVHQWSIRWYESQRDAGGAQAHLERMKQLEALSKARVASGQAPRLDAVAAAYFRAEAEIWASAKD